MIGNIPCLEEWNTELPGLKLVVPQPFFYSKRTQVGLPILRSSMNTITHKYKIRTKLKDILRMRVKNKEGEVIKEIKCKLEYLDFKSEDIPIPELWGRFALMTDAERNWRKSVNEKGVPFSQTIYIEDIISTQSNNPVPLGETVDIPLQYEEPVKHLFWVAQKVKSLDNRNFSNYTTNTESIHKGWNPCEKTGLKYGGSYRIPEFTHEHFELSEPWDLFPSAPSEPGYNCYSFGYEPGTLHADTAVNLGSVGSSLLVTLKDTNPFIEDEEQKEHYDENGDIIPIEALEDTDLYEFNRDKYIIHVRMLTMKKLTVSWSEKEKKLKYTFHN